MEKKKKKKKKCEGHHRDCSAGRSPHSPDQLSFSSSFANPPRHGGRSILEGVLCSQILHGHIIPP